MIRRLVPLLVVPLLLVGVMVTATAAPRVADDDLDKELTQVKARVAEITAGIDATAANRTALANEVLAAQGRLDGLLAELTVATEELTAVRTETRTQRIKLIDAQNNLRDLRIRLEQTRQDLAAGKVDASNWAREIYMNSGQDVVAFAVGAGRVGDIVIGVEYLNRLSVLTDRAILEYESLQVQETGQVELVKTREKDLDEQVEILSALEDDLADVEAELLDRRTVLAGELAHQRGRLDEVDGQLAHFEGELAALESEQSRIQAAIQAEQATLAAGGGGGGGGDGGGGGGDGVATGRFARPVPGRISSGFGPRMHPILGYSRMHTGLDMSGGYGQQIVAADGGTVIIAGSNGGYGTTVVIDHGGGTSTLYAHQSSLNVSYGQKVTRGAVIGYVGSTGLSTGPHLHFEVRINGRPVDPAPYL